ncbi:MAG: exodeoxyribonuclease III [Myxococcota bacterium]
MDIATFNVNSVKARLDFVLHWLEARRPDVVCLQELKVDAEHFPADAFLAAGYHAQLHAQAQWNGVAVLSKAGSTLVHAGLSGADELGARVVTAHVEGIDITSVYVPNGKTVEHDDYERKLHFLDVFRSYLEHRVASGTPQIVGGDFNICPADIDSYAPQPEHIFHTPKERERMRALFDLGLVDLYREANPDGTMFSWWDYRAGSFHKNRGLRIDLLLASPTLPCGEVVIDRDYRKKKEGLTPSDHAPVIATITAP